MKDFKTDKSKETFHRVFEAALRLFAEKGYEKTTMRAISREGSLGLGALYYYFPSKEAIVLHFYEQLNEQLITEWPGLRPKSPELRDQLEAFLRFKLDKLEPHRHLIRVLLKEAVDPESALNPFSAQARDSLDKSLSIFEGMVTGKDSRRTAKALWLAHLAIIGLWVHRPEVSSKAVAAFADLAPLLSHAFASGALGEMLDELP